MSAEIARIVALLPDLGAPAELWQRIEAAYSSPGRYYHTLAHLVELAEHFAAVHAGPGWDQPLSVALAMLFHDAVYVPGQPDNEARSADMAAAEIGRWLPHLAANEATVRELILLTAGHGTAPAAPLCRDSEHFLDADMAILGAAPERFGQYEADVAREYTAVYPAPLFRRGRARFVRALLALPRIFRSPFFARRYERQARDNLAASLEHQPVYPTE